MNPSGIRRSAIPNGVDLNQHSHGYSPNVVNVPNQAYFQAAGKPPPLPPIPESILPQMNYQSNMGYSPMNRYSNYGYGPSYNNYLGGLNNHYPMNGFMGNYRNGLPFDSNNPSSPFNSIELFVQTVSSLSMMLESTLNATYTSMQAIAGVMDNCNRLRQYLINFLKLGFTVQFVRRILDFCKWILRFIRGKTFQNEDESVWNRASASVSQEVGAEVVEGGRVWPLAAFFGLLLAGPYLIRKLFNSSTLNNTSNPFAWDPNVHGKQESVAIFDFKATQNGFLNLKAGEFIYIPNNLSFKGWCPAINMRNETGLVPINRIRLIKRKPIVKGSETTNKEAANLTKQADPLQQPSSSPTSSAACNYSVDLKPLEEKSNETKKQVN